MYNNDLLVYFGAYATVIFLVYFPMGVVVGSLRPWAAAASIGFHVSIGLFMGLTGFALTMIACDLVFLSPELSRALQAARKLSTRRKEKTAADGTGSSAAHDSEPVAAASAD
ncbi:hypothetical protein [Streptomyces sp. Ag109_O5-1]|uniref:hypothetical protein n=1 Tax=Streptomyces sp. Ag109_O5-1 TaxID=1938851 RepID=UPI001629E942|nr:hypothetical protein [Streptomyces sp. Ag109_O5-1]